MVIDYDLPILFKGRFRKIGHSYFCYPDDGMVYDSYGERRNVSFWTTNKPKKIPIYVFEALMQDSLKMNKMREVFDVTTKILYNKKDVVK